MKKAFCFGHHGMSNNFVNYDSFEELPKNFLTILKNRVNKNLQIRSSNEMPYDDLIGTQRSEKFIQYANVKIKHGSYYDRFMLMNDQVTFFFYTGSYEGIEFETFQEAKQYFNWVLSKYNIQSKIFNRAKQFKYCIGCLFKIKPGYYNYCSCLGLQPIYKEGDIYRIYDCGSVQMDNKEINWICPSPNNDTMVAVNIPGCPYAKTWLGYQMIPVDLCEIVDYKGSDKIYSNSCTPLF